MTIFSAPNPFVLFLRSVHHALNNRFNEAVSACVGFVKAVDKMSSDARAHALGDDIVCMRGLLVLSAGAMIAMACDIADDLLATGVTAWWRDRWCQTCSSSGLPCKAASSAPILRALHQHALKLRVLADSCSSYTTEESPASERQLKAYEDWLGSLKAPVACDDFSLQDIISQLNRTSNGHNTAHAILALLQDSSQSASQRRQQPGDQRRQPLYQHLHAVIDSEVNAHWREKTNSPSWGCSAEFRMACVERCKHMLLKAQSAGDTSPALGGPRSTIAALASSFFFSVLKQLVHSPPSGKRCTRTEKRVSQSPLPWQRCSDSGFVLCFDIAAGP